MADLEEYKCPACGGALEFNSRIQKMKCPYCDTEFEMDALEAYEQEVQNDHPDDISWQNREESQWQEGETDSVRVYVCESCGGEILADENTGATSCPYCGNPVVMTERFAGALRPDYVIPFKLDKKAAKNAYHKHIQGKPLLPKVFKDENHIEEIKGIYVPFWLFDATAHADVRYRATRVRVWSDKDYNYTQTSFFSVIREGDLSFANVPADGSSRMPDDLMESIEPFDFTDAVEFQTAYLAGYLADKYDVDATQCEERANDRIRRSTESAFRDTVDGYATVTPEHTGISLSDGTLKYALYPVWILNTLWNGQRFTFAMNGQTGKMTGNLPVDNKAYFKWLAGLTTAIAAVILALVFAVNALAWGLPKKDADRSAVTVEVAEISEEPEESYGDNLEEAEKTLESSGEASRNIPQKHQLPRLVDEAGLLTYKEAQELEEKLDTISERHQCDVAVVTTESTYGMNALAYADDFYDYNGYGMGEGDDGILFLLDMGERQWGMSTYGFGITAFTDAGQAYLSQKFLPYLKEGDYAQAFTVYAELCDEFLEQARSGEAFDRNHMPKEPMSLLWIPGSLLIGMVLSLIITGFMRLQMKSVCRQSAAADYVRPGSMRVTRNNDIYLYSHMNRTAKPKETSSGGGSSTHTSSSGRNHGGSSGSF